MTGKSSFQFFDKMGMCTSIVCMVHCMAIPFLAILGLDSILLLVDQQWLEITIILTSLSIGLIAFVGGYIRHKQHYIPVLFVAGFLLIVNGEAVEGTFLKVLLSSVGAMVIAYSHYYNLRLKQYATSS